MAPKGKRSSKEAPVVKSEPQKPKTLRGPAVPWWELGNPCWIGGYR